MPKLIITNNMHIDDMYTPDLESTETTRIQQLFTNTKKDFENKEFLIKKFIGILLKNGKKIKAYKSVMISLKVASQVTHMPLSDVIDTLFLKLKPLIESKKLIKNNRPHIVPVLINEQRKTFLAIKWLIAAAKKKNQNFTVNLSLEIIQSLTRSTSRALFKKQLNAQNAVQNASNRHYRW